MKSGHRASNTLPGAQFTRKPFGYKAVFCDAVTDAGGDLREVEEWVDANGGQKRTVNPQAGTTVIGGGGMVVEGAEDSGALVSYFLIPLDALQ